MIKFWWKILYEGGELGWWYVLVHTSLFYLFLLYKKTSHYQECFKLFFRTFQNFHLNPMNLIIALLTLPKLSTVFCDVYGVLTLQ